MTQSNEALFVWTYQRSLWGYSMHFQFVQKLRSQNVTSTPSAYSKESFTAGSVSVMVHMKGHVGLLDM